jgi:hypothetical protein
MVLQVMAVPVLPFDSWALYYPSWQEVATTILPVAYGAILISISYRYLPIFPQERTTPSPSPKRPLPTKHRQPRHRVTAPKRKPPRMQTTRHRHRHRSLHKGRNTNVSF